MSDGSGTDPNGVAGEPPDGGWPARLAEVFAAAEPDRIALVGERAVALGGEPAGRQVGAGGVVRFASLADCTNAGADARAADLALLTLGAVPEAALDRALGTACRLYPGGLLLLVDAGAAGPLPPDRLFAFGFRRVLVRPDGTLHEFRLRDYKLPPDWLNARFWANPERFGVEEDGSGGFADDDEYEDDEDDEDDDEE